MLVILQKSPDMNSFRQSVRRAQRGETKGMDSVEKLESAQARITKIEISLQGQ
ncbi:hypothetical protein DsansV1_C32g0221461 [Dioscorea sansibarensis]